MLIIIVVAGIFFRFSSKIQVISPGKFYNLALVVSCLSIVFVGLYGILKLF
jgi:hypothetical protein